MQRYLRLLILAGIMITGYLLILAWQKDYGAKPVTATQAPAVVAAPATAASTDVPVASAASDVPAISAGPVDASVSATAATSRLITAQTDLYRAYIDPVGGDLVRLDLLKQTKSVDDNQPYTLLNTQQPLFVAQTMLNSLQGPDSQAGRPTYQAQRTQYQVSQGVVEIPLVWQSANGLKVIKTYRLTAGQYPITISYRIINGSSQPWQGQMIAQLKRDNSPDPNHENQGMMGLATYLGSAWGNADQPYNKVDFDEMGEQLNQTISNGWVGFLQHYFVTAWIPQKDQSVKLMGRNENGANYAGYQTGNLIVPPGRELTTATQLYAGPKYQDQLKALAPGLNRTVDYSWLWPVAQLLFIGLKFFHDFVVHNWGWAIILLTIAVKFVLFPLAAKSYKSMAKMRVIQPELERLKAEHGDDRAKFAQEMMSLYKREGVNPLAGCLPLLLQMPIFLALYWVLAESVELRHAPWLGWIRDLSVMDPYFILPIIMGVTMYVQQLISPQPTDPMQAKVLRLLPVIFTVFMLWFPAGLVLYWIVNNLFTIIQQWLITRKIEQEAARTKVLAS